MTVVPAGLQSRRRSGRLRFGFPSNPFIFMRNRRDRKTNNAIDLMVKKKRKKLNEIVFKCCGKPSKGEKFIGFDTFKLNELDYPDYCKIKICEVYVKLDDEKGECKWRLHRVRTFAGHEGN